MFEMNISEMTGQKLLDGIGPLVFKSSYKWMKMHFAYIAVLLAHASSFSWLSNFFRMPACRQEDIFHYLFPNYQVCIYYYIIGYTYLVVYINMHLHLLLYMQVNQRRMEKSLRR